MGFWNTAENRRGGKVSTLHNRFGNVFTYTFIQYKFPGSAFISDEERGGSMFCSKV